MPSLVIQAGTTRSTRVTLAAGDTLTVEATGKLSVPNDVAVIHHADGGLVTILNDGLIEAPAGRAVLTAGDPNQTIGGEASLHLVNGAGAEIRGAVESVRFLTGDAAIENAGAMGLLDFEQSRQTLVIANSGTVADIRASLHTSLTNSGSGVVGGMAFRFAGGTIVNQDNAHIGGILLSYAGDKVSITNKDNATLGAMILPDTAHGRIYLKNEGNAVAGRIDAGGYYSFVEVNNSALITDPERAIWLHLGRITNSGTITGGNVAIRAEDTVYPSNVLITNLAGGLIEGGQNALAQVSDVTNDGTIRATRATSSAISAGDRGTLAVINGSTGLIEGQRIGINAEHGYSLNVVNRGVISGGTIAIVSVDGNVRDLVDNSGTIDGGAVALDLKGGNDKLIIRQGSSVLGLADGGSGTDELSFDGSAAVTVTLTGATGGGTAGTLTFAHFETFTGSAFDDRFLSAAGAFTFNGGSGIDIVEYDLADLPGGAVFDASGVNLSGAGPVTDPLGGPDKVTGIERFFVSGTAFADAMKGGAVNDILGGGGGNDTLDGNAGNDTLNGGGGEDSITGGSGNDLLRGAGDNDFASGAAGDDRIEGGDGDDRLFGNADNDFILGGNGNDRIDGGTGDDQLRGEAGNDTIAGGDGNDVARGADGNDLLSGNAGNDTLEGVQGNDTMAGGTGADLFRFDNNRAGADVILDFSTAEDRFYLSGGSFTGLTEFGGNTTLVHTGGTILIMGITGLSLDDWNALAGIAPAAAAADYLG
ncbi:MAG: hypothetical protein IT548_01475 [Alphaproteobacteria bacterium]|nr:hypothetical protein [Alphaproteobacteria bacterium]